MQTKKFQKGSPYHSCKSIDGRIFVAKQCVIQLGKSDKSNKRKAEIQYSNKVKSVTSWKCQNETQDDAAHRWVKCCVLIKNVVVDNLHNLSANRFVHSALKTVELVYAIQHFKVLSGKVSVR